MAQQRERIRVVIVEDHPIYRDGLSDAIKRRPELDLVGEAETGREALEAVREHSPDVIVLDMRLPDMDGLTVLEALGREESPARVVCLSAESRSDVVYGALGSGASGFFTKDTRSDVVCDALLAVARGETVIAPEVQAALATGIRERAPVEGPRLTKRESEVLRLTADGLSAREIGERLFLSPTTVKTHLQRVYEKLGVTDRAAAVAEAMRRRILE